MSKTTRSEKEIEKVKSGILEEALIILKDEGFDNLSMYKLGKRTGMTAANLYNYFKNKDQLIIAIHKKTFELLYTMLSGAVKKEGNPAAKMKKIIKTYLKFATDYPNYYDVMFNRRVPQVTDYNGTPEEPISRDEYQSSLRNLNLVMDIGKEVLASNSDLKDADLEFYFIKTFSELHGMISLYNSGLLKAIVKNPDRVMARIADDSLATYLKK
ncbi:MAG: TetR/AcrR family transcriptional regulator [Smithella sp.]|nr:TetR/AcrR family transcriptional regulator [Smithella sp.]